MYNTKIVDAHAQGKWNYCVRIVIKNHKFFEINSDVGLHRWFWKRKQIVRQWTNWCVVFSGNVQNVRTRRKREASNTFSIS